MNSDDPGIEALSRAVDVLAEAIESLVRVVDDMESDIRRAARAARR